MKNIIIISLFIILLLILQIKEIGRIKRIKNISRKMELFYLVFINIVIAVLFPGLLLT